MNDKITPDPAGGSVAMPGTRRSGFVGQNFPLGRWLEVRRVDTPTLTAVAADSGFTNAAAFAAASRRAIGQSPRSFRAAYKAAPLFNGTHR